MSKNIMPELIFGLVGPIGVNMAMVEMLLKQFLSAVHYNSHTIRITEIMKEVDVGKKLEDTKNPLQHYQDRIDYANAVRKLCGNDAALAALAVSSIRDLRKKINKKLKVKPKKPFELEDLPVSQQAYIIRQLKRPEEIFLLRSIYGRKFIQISVSMTPEDKELVLSNKIASQNPEMSQEEAIKVAQQLVERDLNESNNTHGQRINEVFHLGDVFVSSKNEEECSNTIRRFVEAFFGRNSISPNRDEYAAYISASAALRSIDIARQVGAAIFSQKGEIISMGCNEVPAPGGGTYWCDDPTTHRDFEEGHDANNTQKRRILYDFIKRLYDSKLIETQRPLEELFQELSSSENVKNSMLMDITEFGRMAHAEMSALLDAARLGRPTKGATLYSTTFPCHNCAKHIITAGIQRVVYIEPYPKSQAITLHKDSISFQKDAAGKVIFEHFVGISPRRYRDIFEKGKRRNSEGELLEWQHGEPTPSIEDKSPFYVQNEVPEMYAALEKILK
jgi:deoxycytidylate deaminase